MAAGTKICKVCGVEYPYCRTASVPGVFRWQDVACCEEHGRIYLEQIIASRSGNKEEEKEAVSTSTRRRKSKKVVVEQPKETVVESTEEATPIVEE